MLNSFICTHAVFCAVLKQYATVIRLKDFVELEDLSQFHAFIKKNFARYRQIFKSGSL